MMHRLIDRQDWQKVSEVIAQSGLFSEVYYRRQLSRNNYAVNLVQHYLEYGANAGLNPHPLFDTAYYLEANSDVLKSGLNPLQHYIESGAKEGRNPHPLFDTQYYLANHPDVEESGQNPLSHYINYGGIEGRSPHPLFDGEYYLNRYPDVRIGGMNPLLHYLEYGAAEGRECSPLFSVQNYLQQHPKVEELGLNPLLHYLTQDSDNQQFLYLPWQSSTQKISDQFGYYNILVFSHDASRTGAPLLLLSFLKTLKQSGYTGINVWIVLAEGGELEEDFQDYGLTVQVSRLASRDRDREDVLRTILESFKQYATRAMVLVNTAAIPQVNALCEQIELPVLSWIHELPASIDMYLGGYLQFRHVLSSSRKIFYPSEFVRNDLLAYAPEADHAEKSMIMRYGAIAPDSPDLNFPLSEHLWKGMVRSEFNLPLDVFIVLGCGTITPRKGCDIFVQVANQVIRKLGQGDVFFLWVGEAVDPPFFRWLQHDLSLYGLTDHVIFTGKRENPGEYMRGCDVFALTSREDPFPLVNLEAMYYGLPVVSFLGGGGAPEVHTEGRGIPVNYLDIDEMAKAIVSLKQDTDTRIRIGAEAKRYTTEELTWSNIVDQVIDVLEQEFDYHPVTPLQLTVIIPNYNHERFIEERIFSITNQTVKPDEIILLDDCSSDKSVEIAVRSLEKSGIPYRVILNDKNTGSPFHQWVKGIQAASYELVWIAESDDTCALNLIEQVKPQFYDPDVALAFCQSAPMSETGERYADNYHFYTDDISPSRWRSFYTDWGKQEIAQSLCQKNVIPNASAVIFRKAALDDQSLQAILRFRFAGDWFLYFSLLKGEGKIAFVPKTLNYHRRHSGTVTSKVEREDRYALEVLDLKHQIFAQPYVSADAICASLCRTIDDYYRLNTLHNLDRPTLTENPALQDILGQIRATFNQKAFGDRSSVPGILVILGDAEVGGGQIAGLRLANELAKNYRVFLCNAQPHLWDEEIIQSVDERVVLLEGSLSPAPWSHQKHQRINIIRELIQFFGIDLLFSHIWWADRFAYEINQTLHLPWFIAMHGCYEALTAHPDWDQEFLDLVEPMMRSVSGVCYLSQKNLLVFEKLSISMPQRIKRLFHGFDRNQIRVNQSSQVNSHLIKQEENEFVFCLCSRAIPEKGWQEAIEATIAINRLPAEERNDKKARLVLIGHSAYAEKLRARFGENPQITFLGQQKDPTQFFLMGDVGLLPTRFQSESLPCTLVEYLACGLPVISTNIGSIPEMLTLGDDRAGFVLPLSNHLQIDVQQLQDLMLKYMVDENLYLEHKNNAQKIFEQLFDIGKLVDQYTNFFEMIAN